METFSALLAICAGNSPVPGEFPTQRPVTRSFDVNFDLRPNKRLSKQSRGWWFETLSRPLWRHHNGVSQNGQTPSIIGICSYCVLDRPVFERCQTLLHPELTPWWCFLLADGAHHKKPHSPSPTHPRPKLRVTKIFHIPNCLHPLANPPRFSYHPLDTVWYVLSMKL